MFFQEIPFGGMRKRPCSPKSFIAFISPNKPSFFCFPCVFTNTKSPPPPRSLGSCSPSLDRSFLPHLRVYLCKTQNELLKSPHGQIRLFLHFWIFVAKVTGFPFLSCLPFSPKEPVRLRMSESSEATFGGRRAVPPTPPMQPRMTPPPWSCRVWCPGASTHKVRAPPGPQGAGAAPSLSTELPPKPAPCQPLVLKKGLPNPLLSGENTKGQDSYPSSAASSLCNLKSFPGGSMLMNLPVSAREEGSIPGLGRSPGEGNGNPLQYSFLENPMDRGAWRATVHGIAKEPDTTEWLNRQSGSAKGALLRSKAVSRGLLLPYCSAPRNALPLEVSASKTPWPFWLSGSRLLPTLGHASVAVCLTGERGWGLWKGAGAPGADAVTASPAATSALSGGTFSESGRLRWPPPCPACCHGTQVPAVDSASRHRHRPLRPWQGQSDSHPWAETCREHAGPQTHFCSWRGSVLVSPGSEHHLVGEVSTVTLWGVVNPHGPKETRGGKRRARTMLVMNKPSKSESSWAW